MGEDREGVERPGGEGRRLGKRRRRELTIEKKKG